MIKHFYFGVISPEELDSYGEDFSPFVLVDGTFSEFCIELDVADGFMRIYDTLGRMVPIDKAHFHGLVGAVQAMEEMQYAADEIEEDLIALNTFPDMVFHN